MYVWQTAGGKNVHILQGHRGWARGVAWSPDGSRLASTGQDAAVRVWDVETGAQVAALSGASLPTWSVTWLPDGSRLAAGNGRYEGASTSSTVFVLALPEP